VGHIEPSTAKAAREAAWSTLLSEAQRTKESSGPGWDYGKEENLHFVVIRSLTYLFV
jgi:hypothetical protein